MRLAALAAAALLLLPALAISAATGDINLSTPSSPALADIPPDYLLLYQQAGLAFDIPWEVLAAIGKVECDHGRYPDPACRQLPRRLRRPRRSRSRALRLQPLPLLRGRGALLG